MKIALKITCIAVVIYLVAGLGATIFLKDSTIVWEVGGGCLMWFVALPWIAYWGFKVFLHVLYQTRRTWLLAAEDTKNK